MTKYLLNRLLRGVFSIIIVVGIVMVLIYSMLNRDLIFANDPNFTKQRSNGKEIYMMQQWEKYGYVDYIPYADYLKELLKNGEITQEKYDEVAKLPNKFDKAEGEKAEMIAQFTQYYEDQGYTVVPMDAVMKGKTKKYQDGGEPRLYAHRDVPLTTRLVRYLTGLIDVDNIHYATGDIPEEERGLTFTWKDPAYGGEKFSPAIIGNGTKHKYLLYMTDSFPFIHQNLVTINLGQSYSIEEGTDIFDIMTSSQGSYVQTLTTYPTGAQEISADDLHSARYVPGSLANGTPVIKNCFVDDYTSVLTNRSGFSKVGYSFVIGIISVFMAYLFAIPLGTLMALRKDKLVDKLGTAYIVFIIAVPSLAYIFLFKAIGGNIGLPTTFDMENPRAAMYVLPIVSLALPSIANMMKWLRRYMIDQMNSDYVKFARSGGLSEGEIFSKHILKNAIIPIMHGVPGNLLFAMTGAIITERVYVVPGAGNLLTKAINAYDNGVIVGMVLFYACLSVVAIILGDILMSVMDPRISFTTTKER